MRKRTLFSALVVLVWGVALRAENIQLLITGSHCNKCGDKIAAALGEVNELRVKAPIRKGKGDQGEVKVDVKIEPAKGDLGDIARAVAAADTPHRAKSAPTTTLLLKAPNLNEDNAKGVAEILKDVKGVEGQGSSADVKGQMIHVRLSDKGGAKLAEIQKALAEYTKKQ